MSYSRKNIISPSLWVKMEKGKCPSQITTNAAGIQRHWHVCRQLRNFTLKYFVEGVSESLTEDSRSPSRCSLLCLASAASPSFFTHPSSIFSKSTGQNFQIQTNLTLLFSIQPFFSPPQTYYLTAIPFFFACHQSKVTFQVPSQVLSDFSLDIQIFGTDK